MAKTDANGNKILLSQRIPVYTEFDLNYNWQTPWDGSVDLGINNVFDTIGGVTVEDLTTGNQGIRSATTPHSAMGRTYTVRVSQNY